MHTTATPDERTWAEIDLAALLHNFNIARATGKQVMCVVKADAYGHGMLPCAVFLEQHGADAFAVACLQEALELRLGGVKAPLLILGYTPSDYLPLLVGHDIIQTVVDECHADELDEAANAAGVRLRVHVKIDTGMSRLGIFAQGEPYAQEAAAAVRRINEKRGLVVEGLYTHCAVADTESEDAFTAYQAENFAAVIGQLESWGIRPPVCHAGNSACILRHPSLHFDMVREGIMLYGMYPDSIPQENGMLRPVMSLKSRIAQIKELPAGTSVSYGRIYQTNCSARIALVSAGYADGYPRRLSNHAYAVIAGKQYPQVGRVCMDMLMADITGAQDIQRGDIVTLLGAGGMCMEEAAQAVGTVNYELTCLVCARAKRVYVNG